MLINIHIPIIFFYILETYFYLSTLKECDIPMVKVNSLLWQRPVSTSPHCWSWASRLSSVDLRPSLAPGSFRGAWEYWSQGVRSISSVSRVSIYTVILLSSGWAWMFQSPLTCQSRLYTLTLYSNLTGFWLSSDLPIHTYTWQSGFCQAIYSILIGFQLNLYLLILTDLMDWVVPVVIQQSS